MKIRRQLDISGSVQGLGVRPYVYNLATELGLQGSVMNTSGGLTIDIQGEDSVIEEFSRLLDLRKPPLVEFRSSKTSERSVDENLKEFVIAPSAVGEVLTSHLLADLATCSKCEVEIFDSRERRYRYPFTNCTYCGPRYSITKNLPYDRAQTSMAGFSMCESCQREYENPADRRFHAQPIACPQCGPQLQLWAADAQVLTSGDEALGQTVTALRQGKIIAVKGLGGFHLMVDAENKVAVSKLRERKGRGDKPFAVMFANLAQVQQVAEVGPKESDWLEGPYRPIVILKKTDGKSFWQVGPEQNTLGVLLPYTPLHHLLLRDFGGPLVCTSGNLSEEPICIDEHQALEKLAKVADLFLVHNRPILRPVEDSVLQVVEDKPMLIRRGRGLAPQLWPATAEGGKEFTEALALGGDLKHAMGLCREDGYLLAPHVGDLEESEAFRQMVSEVNSWQKFFGQKFTEVLVDSHPHYHSHQWAKEQETVNVTGLQHHRAHAWALWAEHGGPQRDFVVIWDGLGFGDDKTIWGGEFFVGSPAGELSRWGAIRPFDLYGGDKAIRDTRRSCLSLLDSALGPELWDETQHQELLQTLGLSQDVQNFFRQFPRSHRHQTTSMGRLFDGVASLLGIYSGNLSFEGQAAMKLQALAELSPVEETYSWEWVFEDGMWWADWRPVVLAMMEDLKLGSTAGGLARRFHQSLADMIVAGFKLQSPCPERVLLGGGCMQNSLLVSLVAKRFSELGIELKWPELNPPGDGGLALGQMAWWMFQQRNEACV
ncbi:MAG: carbamoyltransferase HypF [Bdellovibrionaceae bacterium]|nr:carbamoyltransferase HypF [Bdellovibrionales bacterium]MCB9084012.1 carbamoyltransferase HypF [Pseudobdellovibrionaceae bacterium]